MRAQYSDMYHRGDAEMMTPEQVAKFAEAIEKIEADQKAAEEIEKKRPHIEFMKSAHDAGFTDAQATFMWKRLARKHHEHWDGRVG